MKILSVRECGLEDLDGLTYAANLTELIAGDNEISQLLPLTDARKINVIDLEK